VEQLHRQSIPKEKFLTMSANLLYRAFLDAGRTEAKRLYRELADGRVLALTEVQMEDKSRVRFDLALDYTELAGKLSFGAFRASVTTLVHNLGETLRQAEAKIPVFAAENDPEMTLFGVTAVTYENEEPRVMVLGADTRSGRPVIQLRLMYLNPGQFEAPAGDTVTV
jgi:hypothetical protein